MDPRPEATTPGADGADPRADATGSRADRTGRAGAGIARGVAFDAVARFPVPVETLWAWHAAPGAFERLAPPWDRVVVVSRRGSIVDGELVMRVPGPPGMRRWVARMGDADPGRRFVDVQTSGPFRAWRHEHRMAPDGAEASVLTDALRYELPFPPLGRLVGGRFVARTLARLFRFRHRRTLDDVVRHHAFAGRPRLRVAVTGTHGFVGGALAAFLSGGGHTVVPMVRGGDAGVRWDPVTGAVDALAGVDAVVHLAGAGIADRRWTTRRKAELRASRVAGTAAIARALAACAPRPRVLVCASAVGIYGDRGDEDLDERSAPGTGFLAEMGTAWEAAADPARQAGIRVVHARFGVVLGAAGGALARMRRPFALGLGGPMGDGRAWVPWVALDDAVGAIHHALFDARLEGPVVVAAPAPVRWRDLASTLGAVLRRPSFLRMPRPVARVVFGELADAVLLASARAVPRRLADVGFAWAHPDLGEALAHELGRSPPPAKRP